MKKDNKRILYFDSTSFDRTYSKLQKDLGGELLERQFILNDPEIGQMYLEYFDIGAPFQLSINYCHITQDLYVKDTNESETTQLFILFMRKNSSIKISDYASDEMHLGARGVKYNIMLRQNQKDVFIDIDKDEEMFWIGMRMDLDKIGPLININKKDSDEFIDYLLNQNYYEESNTELESIVEELFHAQKLTIGRNAIIGGLGLQLMGKLLIKLFEHKKKKLENKISEETLTKYFEIKDYILSDYNNIPTTKDIALKFGIGETKLKEDFKKVFDQSIFSFITSHRMMDAHRLLRSTDDLIGDISKEVGYSHLSKFTGAFKKYYGYTPSELRGSKRIKHF
ncbi:helix-turn-helix domain-containing protein [Flammeovirga yaeyamensis]|uniref:Helix-turn-helix domain-containing protein n=1 Tax=Flammeovirga yaeyamensis TaxID=367791 RepID=A0AAX1N4Z1_9BACT|nr:AraC family transcriptional regulator [Flammeovirga yaeyamensis]MBB3700140.1 AraC-like DNA-binding protein [Flammeovirga yaeyamensis]NMF37229.1 helix-turn-helix transcriptional regulator [Flammeovirga yaeyamensis]QWG00918.1 helix-turn-helix domain-containing protein [Flammeovirga yaeyamensis]